MKNAQVIVNGRKLCSRCKLAYPLSCFGDNMRYSSGYQAQCNRCRAEMRKKDAIPRDQAVSTGTRVCSNCRLNLPIANFGYHKLGKGGRRAQCRQCRG